MRTPLLESLVIFKTYELISREYKLYNCQLRIGDKKLISKMADFLIMESECYHIYSSQSTFSNEPGGKLLKLSLNPFSILTFLPLKILFSKTFQQQFPTDSILKMI